MMSEDPTKDLTAVEMLRLVLADVRDIKARLATLEARVEDRFGAVETELATLRVTVDDRFKDTRPIWQAINQRTERMEETLLDMKEQMHALTGRELELVGAQSRLSSRVTALENRARDGERRAD
jgi:hypothetical protein